MDKTQTEFYRVSARNPMTEQLSKSDLKIWTHKDKILASLDYWQFSNENTDDLDNFISIDKDIQARLASELFGIPFNICEVRGLCYEGIAVTTEQVFAAEMINENGICYTASEQYNDDINKEFFVWELMGEIISPLLEGDGFVIKPTEIIDKYETLEFVDEIWNSDLSMSGVYSWYLKRNAHYCCKQIEETYGDIWINRNSVQYNNYMMYGDDYL